LYFIACGRRLALGYVDHAPLVPWIARASSELFGDSLHALRLAPALARGLVLVLVLTVMLVRRFGGRTFAQLVAGLAVLVAPAFLRMGSVLCIPVFEPLFWTGCSYLVVRIIQTGRSRLWLAVGALAGVGVEALERHLRKVLGLGDE
jgi:4-amino-4-deoxy-L-arabinose transferase-like glycosyltransferase